MGSQRVGHNQARVRTHTHTGAHTDSLSPLKCKLRSTWYYLVGSLRGLIRTLTHLVIESQGVSGSACPALPDPMDCSRQNPGLYHWAIRKVLEGYSFGISHSSSTAPTLS